jgi:hypothetical protein
MSGTNDTSKLSLAAQDRELRDDELDAVTGGGEKANYYASETITGRRIQKFQ